MAKILIKKQYHQKICVKERNMNLYSWPQTSSFSLVRNVKCAKCRFLREADINGKTVHLCAAHAMKKIEQSQKIQCLRFYRKDNPRGGLYGIANIAMTILTWINSINI